MPTAVEYSFLNETDFFRNNYNAGAFFRDMTFLDDLLTFDGDVHKGEKLELPKAPKRSWLNKLMGRPTKPAEPEYRLHQTVAGFPLVLPHQKDGRLYLPGDPAIACPPANLWRDSRIALPLGFHFDVCTEHENTESTMLYSRIRKFFGESSEENDVFNPDDGIDIAYLVTSQGEIATAELNYHFDQSRNVSFLIYRGKSSRKVLAKASGEVLFKFNFDLEGKFGIRYTDRNIPFVLTIDYERTLQNLARIMKKEIFAAEDITSLLSLQYQCAAVAVPNVNVYVSSKKFLH